VAGFARHSLDWLSHHWPGLPYPYEKTTVFQGFAGMEYPMMANDETYPDTVFSKFVAEHEIAHTYMPFYMGVNETRYGFMDEGWATTFEYFIGIADLGKEKADEAYKEFRVHPWVSDYAPDQDIPIIFPGDVQTGAGLGSNEYVKPSLGYMAVKDILGDALFKKCLLAYMDRWHGKHPSPWDFFYTFNDVSGKDLNWFWKNWFFSPYRMDVSVNKVIQEGQGYTLYLDNVGGLAIPFELEIKYGDGSTRQMHLTPSVWENNPRQAKIEIPGADPARIQVHTGIYLDIDESNNRWAR
jgi:hypothetical protein